MMSFIAILPRITLAALLVAGLGACGGGGGNEAVPLPPATTSEAIPTYGRAQLPGRLLVNSPLGTARIYDLTTGRNTVLPASGVKAAGSPDGDVWTVAAGQATLMRQTDYYAGISGWHPPLRIQRFDLRGTPLAAGSDWPEGYFVGEAQLSPDGRYVLAMHEAPLEDARLKVLDAATGAVVKDTSLLDDSDPLLTRCATWLPDGRYVYMVGNVFYASAPTSTTAQRLATLALPSNFTSAVTGAEEYISGQSTLVASPDGQRIAFTWREKRGNGYDTNIWVAKLDGTELRRLTTPPDPNDALSYRYSYPSWSPDGQWIAGLLDMHGTSVSYQFPSLDPQDLPPALLIVGTTGCGNSQVFAVPAGASQVALSWPTLDARYGIKVLTDDAKGVNWLTSCSSVAWLP